MRNKKLFLFLLPLVAALSSCGGYSLEYIVSGDKYNSANFLENYYEHWDAELKNATVGLDIKLEDNYMRGFDHIGDIDDILMVDNPYLDKTKYPTLDQSIRAYSADQRLMNYDQSFYYGVQSKLFDGEAYCDSYYQKHRVQTNESGFSVRFTKESDELNYFAMQFKSTTNNQVTCYPVGSDIPVNAEKEKKDKLLYHSSTFELVVSVYNKTDNGIVANKFTSTLTNTDTNDGRAYIFYGFDLKPYELSRCVGFSVTYTLKSDELIAWNEGKQVEGHDIVLDYALFIYEVYLPYTYWH